MHKRLDWAVTQITDKVKQDPETYSDDNIVKETVRGKRNAGTAVLKMIDSQNNIRPETVQTGMFS